MLREFSNLRQEHQGFRRLFTDDKYQLYLWYSDREREILMGFQLIYQYQGQQKALTWNESGGYQHSGVDEGESWMNPAPLLVEDGFFQYAAVKDDLIACLESAMDPDVKLVLQKIVADGELPSL